MDKYILLVLFMVLIRTEGQTTGPQEMCISMTPQMEECQNSFNGKPMSNEAIQVRCMQVREMDKYILLVLFMVLIRTEGQTTGPQEMCISMTPQMEECQRSFIGKPMSNEAIQVRCMQVREMDKYILLVLFMVLIRTEGQTTGPQEMCISMTPQMEECQRSFIGKPMSNEAIQVRCMQRQLWNMVPNSNLTARDLAPVERVINSIFAASGIRNIYMLREGRRPLVSPSGFRLRSEYRALTDRQRRRFHRAMNRLYEDGVIAAFGRIHAVGFLPQHGGASFLAWHRILLVVFEELLRKVDPTVSLPYLDTSIDDAMDNPVNSILWTPEYLGIGIGPVVTGPFAGWVTDQGNLERDIGRNSRLFHRRDLRNVLTRCRLEEISIPTARPMFDFEVFHGGPHSWIGGDMGAGRTTAYDPAFYLHHAFVDYIWELFRTRQRRRCGVNPVTDYPTSASGSHAFDTTMVALSPFINGDGLADYWTQNFYGYNLSPSCPRCVRRTSGRPPIRCDRSRGICVATSRIILPQNMPVSQESMTAVNNEMLEEIYSMREKMVPRNRGKKFHSPGGDGRTQESAMMDAMNNVLNGGFSRQESRTAFPSMADRFRASMMMK